MALNRISSRAASALPVLGIVLALANWNNRPNAGWGWAAAIAMCLVMIAVRRFWQLAVRRSPGNDAVVRSLAEVTEGVIFGGLVMVITLAVTLAHAYGFVSGPHRGQRVTMIILGAYLVVTGNAMPKRLATAVAIRYGAPVQAFHRFAGWTWVLCGLGFVTAWLALPIGAAAPVSIAIGAIATIVTLVRLRRLGKLQPHARA